MPHQNHRLIVPTVPLANTQVAWPTLLLFAIVVWVSSVTGWSLYGGHCAIGWGVALLSVASYAMFTVMHEAVHGSIFEARWANTCMGTLASVFMGPTSSFTAYQSLHLQHHRCTNDPQTDPDYYSGAGPWWWLPVAWLTTDLQYYWFFLKTSRTRPIAQQVRVVFENALMVAALFLLVRLGWWREALVYWVLPSRLATALLAWGFNYLPHWPYAARAQDNPYLATRVVWPNSWWAALLLQAHNLHQMHHLFPGVAFYRYAQLWRDHGASTSTKGSHGH
jgi:beta-carotene hydroxylase